MRPVIFMVASTFPSARLKALEVCALREPNQAYCRSVHAAIITLTCKSCFMLF